jgi:phage recombination protein Bet
MNTAVTHIKTNTPSLAVTEEELMNVLRNSLFVGAKDESIKMAVSYCRAAGLDIMQKPVHLVPMNVKKPNGEYEWRDVVMPGIGLYRTQAARSGDYAGVTEPDFGEDVTETLSGVSITYPKWCKVTVKRIVGEHIVEFTAKELWKENYASNKKDTTAPNAMWEKRPYAQLAKCAEAQALRKAFPEFGAAPTADEMEGKDFEMVVVDGTTGVVEQPAALSAKGKTKPVEKEVKSDEEGTYEGPLATDGMKKVIKAKLEGAALSETDMKAKFQFGIDDMPASAANDVLDWIAGK